MLRFSIVSVFVFYTQCANGQSNTTVSVQSSMLVDGGTEIKLNDVKDGNRSMEQIMQPMENATPTKSAGMINSSQNGTLMKGFRPSPQLETYYEFNRYPVVPAFPEAKGFNGYDKPIRSEIYPWLTKNAIAFPSTTQQPWYSKINFPTTPFSPKETYPYFTSGYPEGPTSSPYPYIITGSPESTRSYPYVIVSNKPELTTRTPGIPSFSSFAKFGGFNFGNSAGPNPYSTKYAGFDKGIPYDKSSYGNKGYGSTGIGGSSYLPNPHHEVPATYSYPSPEAAVSPWKKIIKFLSAAIPIGLLISALTPNVINISATNMTQVRGRSEEKNDATRKLIASLKYINKLNEHDCEKRIICELLMGAAASSNAEEHVKNLLRAFTEHNKDGTDHHEELRRILEVVKKGDCNLLVCNKISQNNKGSEVNQEAEKIEEDS